MKTISKKITDKIVFDAKVSERKILILPISSLKPTPYNPVKRTKDSEPAFKSMAENIKKYGLQYPVLITADREVIDGNRRLAICKSLGMAEIEVIVSNFDRDEVFTMVNTSAIKINNKNWLEIGRGGGKLPAKERVMYNDLFKLVGTYGVDLLIEKNLGLGVLVAAKTVCSYGTALRLDQVIITAARGKLFSKLDTICRNKELSRDEKMRAMDDLLGAK